MLFEAAFVLEIRMCVGLVDNVFEKGVFEEENEARPTPTPTPNLLPENEEPEVIIDNEDVEESPISFMNEEVFMSFSLLTPLPDAPSVVEGKLIIGLNKLFFYILFLDFN